MWQAVVVASQHLDAPVASIVIATRDRPIQLGRCLVALQRQETVVPFEIVIVDDGSHPPVSQSGLASEEWCSVRTIRCHGNGPARARNVGVKHARGPLILFTDDDTIPAPGWVDAAVEFMAQHPQHVGVEGPTTTLPYDPLYFHSVAASAPGSFLTCNVAYRRTAIDAVGGFAEVFPYAHAEDLDLGFRIARLGPFGYESRMTVLHPPMATSLMAEIRRGRQMVSNGHLFRRHLERYPVARRVTPSGYALMLNAKHWAYSVLRDRYRILRSPRRALRFAVLASGFSAVGTLAVVRDALIRALRT